MKILVTGGTGMLGKNLQIHFKEHWDEFVKEHPNSVINFVGSENGKYSLTSPAGALALFSYYKPDVVIAAAANVGGIGKNKKYPADLCLQNSLINAYTFEYSKFFGVKYICLIGTTCQYPMYTKVPFKEDDLWAGTSEITNRSYSEAKRLAFTLHDAYREQYGLKGVKLVPANLYGPHDNFDPENSHVVPALIKKIIEAKQTDSKKVYCWGTGVATRDLLHVNDLSKAIYDCVKNQIDTTLPINIGTGSDICIGDLAYMIADIIGYDGEIVFTGEVSDGQIRRQLDVSRAKEMLDFEVKISLRDGIKQTIEWYKNEKK